ncbi:MAG: hypothetical protein FJZ96_06280 [Chloroflexi bacterium]|nr:hypothetical protein [Chloroflexota bacterium]
MKRCHGYKRISIALILAVAGILGAACHFDPTTLLGTGGNVTPTASGQGAGLDSPATEAAPPTPTLYPQPNGWIAFESARDGNTEIYVMPPDGSMQNRLTFDPAEDRDPVWSPDGSRIAFTSNRNDNWDIYIMDANGSNLLRLTDDPAKDAAPAWSPEGNMLVFESYRNQNWDIYLVPADSGVVTRLTDDPDGDSSPTWSPDGDWIAFTSNRNGNADIYIIQPDGNNLARLTTDPAPDADPHWSPDGGRIAFRSWRDGDPDIYLVNKDGSNLLQLTLNFAEEDCLAWSPDGNLIAYCTDANGLDWEIVIQELGTGLTTVLAPAPGNDSEPTWSRDSLYLAFQSGREGSTGIFRVRTDGGEVIRITPSHDAYDGAPVWSP